MIFSFLVDLLFFFPFLFIFVISSCPEPFLGLFFSSIFHKARTELEQTEYRGEKMGERGGKEKGRERQMWRRREEV